jgi:peptidoglycan/LPS O-acetylase OafA/YrhL
MFASLRFRILAVAARLAGIARSAGFVAEAAALSGIDNVAPKSSPKSSSGPAAPRTDDSLQLDRGSDHLRYLAFVDGLRAISILAVVSYHIGVPGISGGFVGVDIFFVISGFLIINQIKAGLSSGRFSIFSFYAQRSLRILPPYLIVLLLTYGLAPFFLSTTEVYWDFLPSATLAPLMFTNVVFFLSQGYFDISGIEKPLLHTWTLSVEEQFYFVVPILLVLVFRLGNHRFGRLAAVIGIVLAAVSLTGAIAQTSMSGRNAAFYLSHWRAWEFVAGGFIGAQAVSAVRRLPRIIIELIGWVGAGCIALAIGTFDSSMPYPSSIAVLPVAGAALVILCGVARPETTFARILSLRWFVAIGLVSYGWYLWHWPILSFIRMARLDESSLVFDSLGGGLLAFVLACVSYRYVEQPIRRWRKSPSHLKNPRLVVLGAVSACLATALLGGSTALCGYWVTKSFLAAHYGVEGKGILDKGCESKSGFAESCFKGPVGVILGDSHATVLSPSFAKRFDGLGVRLISLARGSCGPLLLASSQRGGNRRDDCARLIAPFERLRARPDPVTFAIITANWGYNDQVSPLLSDLISEFDRRTHILLIGPVPIFAKSSLECVVLSDRYYENRDRCVRVRSEVEASTAAIVGVLKTMPNRFPNVRYVDPINIFCDQTICRPFKNNDVFYSDIHHLSQAGADEVYDSFESDFLWLAGKK